MVIQKNILKHRSAIQLCFISFFDPQKNVNKLWALGCTNRCTEGMMMAMWMVASTFHIPRSRLEPLSCLRILQFQWWSFVPRVTWLWIQSGGKKHQEKDIRKLTKRGMPAILEILCVNGTGQGTCCHVLLRFVTCVLAFRTAFLLFWLFYSSPCNYKLTA